MAGTAQAQAQDQAGQTEARSDEIVVTAQLRSQRLQDVPISIEVITGEQRIEENQNSLFDLQESVPSLHIGVGGPSNRIFMRGIGSGTNASFDQSVGTFIDGVYHGRSRLSSGTFLDLERVEILKGPQSTFFGNNAIAGAFSIVTAKPKDYLDGWVRALYGEDGQYAVEGAIGGPITETLGIRVAAGVNGMDGWIENVGTGNDGPLEDNLAGRVTLVFTPSTDFDMTLKVDGSRNRNKSGVQLQIDECPPTAPFTVAGLCGAALAFGAPTEADDRQIATDEGELINLDTLDAALTANYYFGDHTLTSITGYYEYDYDFNFDADGLPAPLVHVQVPDSYDQFSQELRLASPEGNTIDYLAGFYYHKGTLDAASLTSLFLVTDDVAAAVPPLAPYLPLGQDVSYHQTEETISGFLALTWNVTDKLKLTGGLRASSVKKKFNWELSYATANGLYGDFTPLPDALAAIPGALGTGVPGTLSGSRTDDALMPSARIQYMISPDAMVYASYSRGFKAGGFNSGYSATTGVNIDEIAFDPEYVDAFEVGLKSTLLDGMLTFNIDYFYSKYDDLQVTTNFLNEEASTFVNLVRNAASSVSQGVEVETALRITPDFKISVAATYLDAHFVDYPGVTLTPTQEIAYGACLMANPGNPDACSSLQFQDLSGATTPNAPEWSANISGDYTVHLPSDFALTANLTAIISSSYQFGDNDPRLTQPGYTKLNGRLTLESPNRDWALDLIAENLNNKKVLSYNTYYPNSPGAEYVKYQQPRNFAVQLRYKF